MAAPIAAMMIATDRRIVENLRARKALSRDTAQPIAPARGFETRRFTTSAARRVIVEIEPGRFYLDEAAWSAYRAARQRTATIVSVAVTLAAAILLYSLWWRTQR